MVNRFMWGDAPRNRPSTAPRELHYSQNCADIGFQVEPPSYLPTRPSIGTISAQPVVLFDLDLGSSSSLPSMPAVRVVTANGSPTWCRTRALALTEVYSFDRHPDFQQPTSSFDAVSTDLAYRVLTRGLTAQGG